MGGDEAWGAEDCDITDLSGKRFDHFPEIGRLGHFVIRIGLDILPDGSAGLANSPEERGLRQTHSTASWPLGQVWKCSMKRIGFAVEAR